MNGAAAQIAELASVLRFLTPQEMAEVDGILAAEQPVWVPLDGPQTLAYESEADIVYYGGAAGGGKLLRLDEPLPTPSGWTTMGAVRVGDALFDEVGRVCRVTGVSKVNPSPELIRLLFDDGSTIDACVDHQWVTFNADELAALTRRDPEWRERRRKVRPSRATGSRSAAFSKALAERNSTNPTTALLPPTGSVRTTREIAGTLRAKSGRVNHAIIVSKPLDLPDAVLPLDPYVLGAWLGDGTAASGGITGIDEPILDEIRRAGFRVTNHACVKSHGIMGLAAVLREMGVLGDKRVPSEYLRASRGQRLALLQGLMDTDGTVAKNSGAAEFCNTNKAIVDSVREIIVSLGWKVQVRESRARLYGRDCGPKWTLKWMASDFVFRLPRKASLQRLATRRTTTYRYIVGAEPIPSAPGRCIAVDSPSHLYLAGPSMIPTHNSDMLIGLALTRHRRSIIFRREGTQLLAIIDRMTEILRSRDGYNGQEHVWRLPKLGRQVELGSCKDIGDEVRYMGRPHDFIGFDEVCHFLESQFRFLSGWLRTTTPGQRCRIVCAGNPPTNQDGQWVIKFWGPWLDDKHPNPAKPGELRWYAMVDGEEVERPDGTSFVHGGETIQPQSRTFIPSKVQDNAFLMGTGYMAQLQSLPEPLRSQMLRGDFKAGTEASAWQVIPTAWVDAAMARWTPEGGLGRPMDSMGVDVARGGKDKTVLAMRHGTWYAPLKRYPGAETPDGGTTAGLIVTNRRDGAPVHVDVVGVGGSVVDHLASNDVQVVAVNGGDREGVEGQTDKMTNRLKFRNKRAMLWWRFRESLDPKIGDNIALPPDSQLRADLCAPMWKLTPGGILVEPKEDGPDGPGIKKRLGRSPDDGDAVVNASICTVKVSPKGRDWRAKVKRGSSWRSQ